jgi:hypothetical protein
MELYTAIPEVNDKYARLVYSREIDGEQDYQFLG